jgi:hypothetical protein
MPREDLRAVMQRKLKRVHWQQIDQDGVPNLNGCLGGKEFWVHCVTATGWKPEMRRSLVRWICRRAAMGVPIFVFTRSARLLGAYRGIPTDEVWLIDGNYASELRSWGLKKLPRKAVLGVWEGGFAKWDWPAILKALTA